MVLYSLYECKQVKAVYDSEGHLQTRIEDIKAKNLIDECTIKEASKRPNIEEVESNEYFTISDEEKEEELRDTHSDEKDEQTYSNLSNEYFEISIKFGNLNDMQKSKSRKNNIRKPSKIKHEKKHSYKIKQIIQNKSENDDESYFVYKY